MLSEAPGAKTGKCTTFVCVRRPTARRLARATCGCVRTLRAQWLEGLVATKRRKRTPGNGLRAPYTANGNGPRELVI